MIKFLCNENTHDLNNVLSYEEYYIEAWIKARLRLPHNKDIPSTWIIYDIHGNPCGVVCVVGNESMLSFSSKTYIDNVDFNELVNFINFRMSSGNIFFKSDIENAIVDNIEKYYSNYKITTGNFMYYPKDNIDEIYKTEEYTLVEAPSIEKMYNVICDVFAGYDKLVSFEEYYTTTIYKRNHGTAIVAAVEHNGKYVGVGGCYSFGDTVANISGIAVCKEYRGKGIASMIVNVITGKVLTKGYVPVLASAESVTDSLYLKQGYVYKNKWTSIDVE